MSSDNGSSGLGELNKACMLHKATEQWDWWQEVRFKCSLQTFMGNENECHLRAKPRVWLCFGNTLNSDFLCTILRSKLLCTSIQSSKSTLRTRMRVWDYFIPFWISSFWCIVHPMACFRLMFCKGKGLALITRSWSAALDSTYLSKYPGKSAQACQYLDDRSLSGTEPARQLEFTLNAS